MQYVPYASPRDIAAENERRGPLPPLATIALTLAGLCACGVPDEANVIRSGHTDRRSLSSFEPGLGVGVNAVETQTLGQCVTTPLGPKASGLAARLYDELSVRSRTELNDALNIDAALSAQGLWGHAGAKGSYFKNVEMTAANFYWLVHAEYRAFTRSIDMNHPAFRLSDAAKAILAGPGGLKRFRRACGDAFYSSVTLGARYALLYEFSGVESNTIERLRLNASYAGWGIKAGAEFKDVIEMASRTSALTIHSEAEGGGADLSSYATNPRDLERQLAQLRNDLADRGEGTPLQFHATSYDIFPEVALAREAADTSQSETPDILQAELRRERLRYLYRRFEQNIDDVKRIHLALERAAGPEPLVYYGPDRREVLAHTRLELERDNEAVTRLARVCLNDEAPNAECSLSEFAADDVCSREALEAALIPTADFTTLQGWELFFSTTAVGSTSLNIFGISPEPDRHLVRFKTDDILTDTVRGIVASFPDGSSEPRPIGNAVRVPDPTGGQPRPNVCVYNTSELCSLRVVPLAAQRNDVTGRLVKLQLVFFNKLGFIEGTIDLPQSGTWSL